MGRSAPAGLIVAEIRAEYKGNLPLQQDFCLQQCCHCLGIGQLPVHALFHRPVEGQTQHVQKFVLVRMGGAEGQLLRQIEIQRLAVAAGRRDQRTKLPASAPISSFSSRRAVTDGSSPGSRLPAGISVSTREKA